MSETKSIMANPAPLGLLGFAITTIMLNLHNAGIMSLNASILALGIFYGGLAQVMVGAMEYKNGNSFGTLAFTSYGFFWIALVGIWTLPKMGLGIVAATKADMAWFLMLWGIFSAFLFIGTLKMNKATQFVFGSLTLLFMLLALGDATGMEEITKVAGVVGIICGLSAMYTGMAQVLNEVYGRTLMPLGVKKPVAAESKPKPVADKE
ncbi:MAG: hypothetical protein A4E32_02026 [Methanomassiliicoccales archaeon PtaU1.Bin124]|nr:MAG: hypothetical protein A4E32_02026 [Methanomassiliicoccales archaeon PtaU1.Bin124]